MEIQLTQGRVAIVDDCDFAWLNAYTWRVAKSKNRRAEYASTRIDGKHVMMHRLILPPPVGAMIDHADGDGLNNRRSNLRIATAQENMFNRVVSKNNSSGFKGVYFDKYQGRYRASIRRDRRKFGLGVYDTAVEAALAYDAAAREMYGSFARLNFP